MLVQPSFIGYLMRYKLRVMSRGNAFVKDLVLLEATLDSCMNKLSHFWVVGEHIDGQILSLCYSDELFFITVFILVFDIYEELFLLARPFESRQRLDDFTQMQISFNIAHH